MTGMCIVSPQAFVDDPAASLRVALNGKCVKFHPTDLWIWGFETVAVDFAVSSSAKYGWCFEACTFACGGF